MGEERCFYSHMDAKELIGYCDIHCETPRALFSKEQVAQMILLAGEPDDWDAPEDFANGIKAWYCFKEEMKELVKLATARLNSNKAMKIVR